ncbi:hypothetical protein HanXRQr2_Chr15g0693651 [Helianthus annuus]|uniref:Uncharacterized protein n=1 Tax=Helianthus annuus TaxID=4232 RepID=A0A9K3E222_HELAN|nr:hypothetical protein HanXRQr2_Chr15g0693651 [Helianthus annuus]KAJ0831304.1 hypothetical protein HanPSC8_Chr15g0665541 [Helianthus annuus]
MVQDADNCSGDDDRYQSSTMSLLVLLLGYCCYFLMSFRWNQNEVSGSWSSARWN